MKKISHRLTTGMLILTLGAIAILWIYQAVFLESIYMDNKLKNLSKEVNVAEKLYREGNIEYLEDFSESLTYNQNINIEIMDLQGRVVFFSGDMMGRMQGVHNRIIRGDFIKEILEKKEASSIVQYTRLNTEVLTYSKLSEDKRFIAVGSIPIEPIEETIDLLQRQLIYLMLIMIVLSVLIGTFISRTFLRPIKNLNDSVMDLSKGNMNARADIISEDEIGNLASNFNMMASELSKIDVLRKDLVANVSHELRTPLGIIKGYAEMVKDIYAENPKKREESIEIIIDEVDRLSIMVDDILNLSQLQSGVIKLDKEKFNIIEMTRHIVSKYSQAAANAEVFLELEIMAHEEIAKGDVKKIEQVFHNLISNSLKHTKAGGFVKIRISENDEDFRVEIEDSGDGISKEELPYIWDRYYKSRDNDKSFERGAGLGLSIVKAIFQAHQIDYGVSSELGKGSLFYFNINKK